MRMRLPIILYTIVKYIVYERLRRIVWRINNKKTGGVVASSTHQLTHVVIARAMRLCVPPLFSKLTRRWSEMRCQPASPRVHQHNTTYIYYSAIGKRGVFCGGALQLKYILIADAYFEIEAFNRAWRSSARVINQIALDSN